MPGITEKTFQFHNVYGADKEVAKGAPKGASGLVCLADYAKFNTIHDPAQVACYTAMNACDGAMKSFTGGSAFGMVEIKRFLKPQV